MVATPHSEVFQLLSEAGVHAAAIIFFVSVFWIVAKFFYNRWKYDLHKIPTAPGLPVIGHAMQLMTAKDVTQIYREWAAALGFPKIFKYSLMGTDMLFICDTECVKTTVLSNSHPLPKVSSEIDMFIPFIGNDASVRCSCTRVGNCDYIKAFRRCYLTAMSTSNLKMFVPEVDKVLDDMVKVIESRRPMGSIDFQELCVRTSLDTIGVVTFGNRLGGLDGSRRIYQLTISIGRMILQLMYNPFLRLYCHVFPDSERAKQNKQMIDDLAQEWERITQETLSREEPKDGSKPFWYLLRTMINPETGEPLEHKYLRAELGIAVLAGMDTTGHQLSWALGLLASHPRVADKLFKEVSHFEGKKVELEQLAELPYLNAVIKETMRLVHITHGLFRREVPKDMTIMGYRVPKGTGVHVPSNRSVDNEKEWKDPLAFRPERWTEGEVGPDRFVLGFSYGPRDCVGQRLAMLEMRLALIRLVSKYELSTKKGYPDIIFDCRNGLALEAAKGMWLSVEPRFQRTNE